MTSRKSIFKLSAREIREIRQFERSLTLTDEELTRRAERVTRTPVIRKRRRRPDAPRTADSVLAPLSGLSVTARKRLFVFTRDQFTCVDCPTTFAHPEPYEGQPIAGLTLGHIIPRSKGGLWTRENLIGQCLGCNQELGDRVWCPGWRQEPPGAPTIAG